VLNKTLELNSDLDNAWNNKAVCLKKLNRMEEALECYEEALKRNPSFEQGWANKADLLKRMGKIREAIECYDKIIELNPSNLDAIAKKE